MAGKVTLEFTRGALAGKKFEYDEKARVFIGRQEDCAVTVPEGSISRYHCLLEIASPEVRLQDLGSLNGTFLNGEKIGQRDRDKSWEEARNEPHESFLLHDGDVIALGSRCEFRCAIEEVERCAQCGAALPKCAKGVGTVLDGDALAQLYFDEAGRRICGDCHRAAQKAGEAASADKPGPYSEPVALDEKQGKTCGGCGKTFIPKAADNDLCPDCLQDRGKVLDAIMRDVMPHVAGQAQGKPPAGDVGLEGFEKVKILGKGGMGEVWCVKERAGGKLYALKTMLPEAEADEYAKSLFLREASIGEYMQHKNVIRTYRTGCVDDTFYILTELCEGGSVDKLMARQGGSLPLEQATWIILQVLSGLDYMHNAEVRVEIERDGRKDTIEAHGIVHRDFKPGNIFLSDTSVHPVAMVADLGLAKAFDTAGMSQVSKSGTVMGTAVFMPRQQAQGFLLAKPEVDVWAAAASYYNMLTGKLVKDYRPGKNPWPILLGEDAVPIRERDPGIPRALAAVIDRALIEEPELAYKSAMDLRRDIVAALPDEILKLVKEVL